MQKNTQKIDFAAQTREEGKQRELARSTAEHGRRVNANTCMRCIDLHNTCGAARTSSARDACTCCRKGWTAPPPCFTPTLHEDS